jgi:hypothetical protein
VLPADAVEGAHDAALQKAEVVFGEVRVHDAADVLLVVIDSAVAGKIFLQPFVGGVVVRRDEVVSTPFRRMMLFNVSPRTFGAEASWL